jgi:sulfide:quinone oxidoreductase
VKTRIAVLGAGFGGMELATILSETLGDRVEVTLVDRSDAFILGYSKLDVMFGRTTLDAVRLPYRRFAKPGVRLLSETVTAIDPASRRVTTDAGVHDCDVLVVALGQEYDLAATPGLAEHGHEFYSPEGATRLAAVLPRFTQGKVVVGVASAPFKCPPAPSECALMLHDHLVARGIRDRCEIDFVLPLPAPVPPSPDASKAFLAAFAERGIRFRPGRRFTSLDGARRVAVLDDGSTLPFDLFLAVPHHRPPAVVQAAGLVENGGIPVNPRTLETRFPGVYALGDVANQGTPHAGVFAEGAARAVASALVARIQGRGEAMPHLGQGTCYFEFGGDRVASVDIDFLSGPRPTGVFHPPDAEMRARKEHFGTIRRARWFGM